MPKQKSHKGLKKRVKVTAGGKVKHKRSGGGHLMSGKNAKRRRRIAGKSIMTSVMGKNATRIQWLYIAVLSNLRCRVTTESLIVTFPLIRLFQQSAPD